jgi:hypothetical protein
MVKIKSQCGIVLALTRLEVQTVWDEVISGFELWDNWACLDPIATTIGDVSIRVNDVSTGGILVKFFVLKDPFSTKETTTPGMYWKVIFSTGWCCDTTKAAETLVSGTTGTKSLSVGLFKMKARLCVGEMIK